MVQLNALFTLKTKRAEKCFNSSMVQLNAGSFVFLVQDRKGFQFLYGTIKCNKSLLTFSTDISFNSSMVQLNGNGIAKVIACVNQFQFLYGTIKCKG